MYSTRYSCQILMKTEVSRQILKNTQISNFMNIHPQGTELFHVDWQMETDMTKLVGAS